MDKIAWIRLDAGRILVTRNEGLNVFYMPGGKRDPGESDMQTLVREIREELSVDIDVMTASHVATVYGDLKMICYSGEYRGELKPSNEIAEFAWLTYDERDRVSATDQLVFDQLRKTGQL